MMIARACLVIPLLFSCQDSKSAQDAGSSSHDAAPDGSTDASPANDAPALVDAALARPLRIMVLGDSISEGSSTANTYRSHLFFDLRDAELSFDFVGDNQGTCGNINAGINDGWDADHSSFFSATAEQILGGMMPVNACSPAGSGNIHDWAPTYAADIAILHLGTNDCRGGANATQIQDRLAGIIAELRDAVPSVKVIVAQIISSRLGNLNSCVLSLNTSLPAWVSGESTALSPIVLVDQHSGWDANAYQRDAYHPNEIGARRMADRFLPAVRAFFP